MLERRLLVKDERIVLKIVKIARTLKGCDQHPVERERQQNGEHHHDDPMRHLAEDRADTPLNHQATSVRCATRNIKYATATSSGTRKMEIAAPSAKSPPRTPVKNASEGITCVVS